MTAIVAHRGGAGLWPENSPTAFRNTARMPVDQVEFDIHPSRDGRLVVMHDATLDRTTNGSGPVIEQTCQALSHLCLTGTTHESPPLLEDVIAIFRDTTIDLHIEVKMDSTRARYDGIEARIVESLRQSGMFDRAVITSFQLESAVAALEHTLPKGVIWLVRPAVQADLGVSRLIGLALEAGVPALSLRHDAIDAAIVTRCRDAGLRVGAWAVNDEPAIGRMYALAVDGFTTDRPDLALSMKGIEY